MEKEISNGAMLGIVLIALAAIIGLGFGVFSIAKGTANEGVTNVQENLTAVGSAAFTDYDQKVVTGTQVISALQNFEGKPVAILIATQAIKDNTDASGKISNTAAGLSVYKDNIPSVLAYNTNAPYAEGAQQMQVLTSTNKTVQLSFINYNALLNGDGRSTRVGFDQNCWRAVHGFKTNNGKVQFNGITGNVSKSGMAEYVPSGSRFQAYLVKDLSGTIMGIAFEQINSK